MPRFKMILLLVLSCFYVHFLAQDTVSVKLGPENCIYQFKVKDIDGKEFDFACLEGNKILIVNTGSRCMYRNQLSQLQELYEKYKDNGFIVIVFPCNDFFNREPKGNSYVKKIYQKKFGICYPVMAKIHAKGREIVPLYNFLSFKILNGKANNPPKWNFHKYLIDREGFLYKSINPATSPLDKEIVEWIEEPDSKE